MFIKSGGGFGMKSICIVPKKFSGASGAAKFQESVYRGFVLAMVLALALTVFLPGRIFAFAEDAFTGKDPGQVSWNISAQAIEYNQEKQVYIAEGDVVITGGTIRLEADVVQYSDLTKDAAARGNVTLISKSSLRGGLNPSKNREIYLQRRKRLHYFL